MIQQEVKVDMDIVNQLVQMGFPELSAKHAVYNTGGIGVEAATEYVTMNLDSPSLKNTMPTETVPAPV